MERKQLSTEYRTYDRGYLSRQGIEKRAMGYACAVGLVLLIIVMIINIIQLALTGTFKKEER